MSEPTHLPAEVHEEAALLPWYITGALEMQERERISRHLQSCDRCRRDLDELTHIQRELAAFYNAQPEPSPTVARSVMATVAQEAASRQHLRKASGGWLTAIDQGIRSLLNPQWVPTLAAIFLAVQSGFLLWTMRSMPPTPPDESITTRAIGSPAVAYRIVFQEHATATQIRLLLETIHCRIVDGPRPDRTFIIELTTGDPVGVLNALRTGRDVVLSAEPSVP